MLKLSCDATPTLPELLRTIAFCDNGVPLNSLRPAKHQRNYRRFPFPSMEVDFCSFRELRQLLAIVTVTEGNTDQLVRSLELNEAWIRTAREACQQLAERRRRIGEPLTEDDVRALPEPATRVEEWLLHGLLFEMVVSAPRASHRTLQVVRALNSYRQPSVAQRGRIAARNAAAIIDARFSETLDVAALASEIDCHPTTLRRSFRRTFKMSLRQYHARARVRAAFRLFQQGTDDVLAVARQVGYVSERICIGPFEC